MNTVEAAEGLGELQVLDLGLGMSAALIAKALHEAGLQVRRIAPREGDPFDGIYPAHSFWRSGLDKAEPSELERLASAADICIIGGEDAPGLRWTFDPAWLRQLNPKLIVLELSGYIDESLSGKAADLLVQARTGLVFEQLPDRPVAFGTLLPTYGAALLGQMGLWAALIARQRSGQGDHVRVSLQQGVAMFWSQIWMDAERADYEFDKLPPRGVEHLIFECACGTYIHFVPGVPGALGRVYRLLGIDVAVDPDTRGVPSLERRPRSYFADAELLAPAIVRWRREDLLAALWQAGIPAEPVLRPGEGWDDPQVRASHLFKTARDGTTGVGKAIDLICYPAPPCDPAETPLPQSAGPLAGIRVVDLGNFIAGPVASKYLADLGAEVIKIEPPDGLSNLTGLRNLWACNRGKRSIAVDAKSAEGRAIVAQLCGQADAVHYNFRLGVAKRLGVDPATLRQTNPDVVTLETLAYGRTGPKAAMPGFDMIMQALSGHEARAGGEGNAPLWYRSAFVDYATGALGTIAMMMGLYLRRQRNVAVECSVSLLATANYLMAELVRLPDGRFAGAPLLNAERTGTRPTESLYQTYDGWIAVVARDEATARRFAACCGVATDMPTDSWSEAVRAAIDEGLRRMSTDEALTLLRASDVWVEPCNEDGWRSMRDDPAARAAHAVIAVEDERYGTITSCFGPLINFAQWTPRAFRSAPASGSGTKAVLAEAGYDDLAIATLYERGVVA